MSIKVQITCEDCTEGFFNSNKYSPEVDEPMATGVSIGEVNLDPTTKHDFIPGSHFVSGEPVEDAVLHHDLQSGRDGPHARFSTHALNADGTMGPYIGQMKVTTASVEEAFISIE